MVVNNSVYNIVDSAMHVRIERYFYQKGLLFNIKLLFCQYEETICAALCKTTD